MFHIIAYCQKKKTQIQVLQKKDVTEWLIKNKIEFEPTLTKVIEIEKKRNI